MKVAVLRETYPQERRVALVPANVAQLAKAGLTVAVEQGAGEAAGIPDQHYADKGATISQDRDELWSADVVLQVRCYGANREAGRSDLEKLGEQSVVIGMCDPLSAPDAVAEVAPSGATLFALEMIPRITRAQAMDVLSSQATIAGYRAVLVAAGDLPKMFPMLMTAAGTLAAARVFVIGAGVAGLQAVATARRLGAVVHAYDVRPATQEQVESLGGKFVQMELEAAEAEDRGGYAKAMGEEFYQKQRELMTSVVAESDVVITTAAIPGKPSPQLITAAAVEGMRPGSVIVDLAAERGGNCELSQPDARVVEHGVVIHGPTNLPSEIPYHASQMYSNNVTKFLLNMVEDGQLHLNWEDEIIRDTLMCRQKEVANVRIRELLGLPSRSESASEGLESSEAAEQQAEQQEGQQASDDEPSTGQEESK
jgi:NAD(P) transhydrogenase subunit alpha